MSKNIKVDSLVRINFKKSDDDVSDELKQYNRFVTRVVSKKDLGVYGAVYELRDCVSHSGVPFTFTDDHLDLIK